MIREYVDDILGDGAYDVRGALTIIDGMITGRQGITQSPSVYELAMDNKVCTVELFDFMTNLIIEGTNTAFVAMELRPQGGGVHQADKDQLTKRLEDNLNEFKSACSHYQPTNGEHSKMTIVGSLFSSTHNLYYNYVVIVCTIAACAESRFFPFSSTNRDFLRSSRQIAIFSVLRIFL